jgi:hypothetical protein
LLEKLIALVDGAGKRSLFFVQDFFDMIDCFSEFRKDVTL